MKKLIIRTVVYFFVLFVLSLIFKNFSGQPEFWALGALVLALLNMIVRPIVKVLALPVTILTLGITGIFINMLTIYITDKIFSQITIEGFWYYGLAALAIIIFDSLIRREDRKRR